MRIPASLALALLYSLPSLAEAPPAGVPAYFNSASVWDSLPFSEAVRLGDTLHLSGPIGDMPGATELAPGGIRAEARQAMENIKAALERHGSSLVNVVKCTVFLANIDEWSSFNEVDRSYFAPGRYPARSALGASGLAHAARVEVECIARVPPGN